MQGYDVFSGQFYFENNEITGNQENKKAIPEEETDLHQNDDNMTISFDNQSKKTKRNTQNSARTIVRKVRSYIFGHFNVKIEDFSIVSDPRYILAVVLELEIIGQLQNFQKLLEKTFIDQLSKQNLSDKDKKLKDYIDFFLSLTVSDLTKQNIQQTIALLSTTSQIKKHPPNKQRYSLQCINELRTKILPRQK